MFANAQHFGFVVAFGVFNKAGDLEVREAQSFCFGQNFGGKVFDFVVLFENNRVVYNVFQTRKEPWVNLGQFFDAFNAITFFQCFGNSEDAHIGGV